VNLRTGHRYCGANPILLSLGIFPQLHSREEPGVGSEVTVRCWFSYRPGAVFNAADLDGEA
jgi:hypothetical protein